ncbi:Protein of uncharacterised function (DUF2694) [Mycobacteroides abscessus subsp. abscessus]|uniref:DUF2694 family protein n=1 Tax=Mycobacteroides abscessus TaxID=36809 RepID=UPI0009A891C5|nr:DUF2694 family protein [Mycobacteroides abscessus]SKO35197.1 Protein of uncharacterised function (DUF2694) [Mycobacteroides abscessus subsp. abscessus]
MTEAHRAVHPSGTILWQSGRGGLMEAMQVTEGAFTQFADAEELAEAIQLTADVSFLKAAMQVRAELLSGHTPPSSKMATRDDLAEAERKLRNHGRSN